jgi:hypothetical protein
MLKNLCSGDGRSGCFRGVWAAALTIVVLAGPRAAAGIDLKVDIGVADNDNFVSSTPNEIQSGFEGFSATPEFNGGGGGDLVNLLTTSRNISGVAVTLTGGGNGLMFFDTVTDVTGALGDLLEDSVGTADADLTIQLSGLPAATYSFTGYHHSTGLSQVPPVGFDIYVNTGSGESLAASDVATTIGFDPQSISTSNFQFTATGAEVIVRLDGEFIPGGFSIPTALAGFTIIAVPEPHSGLLLALGLVPLVYYGLRLRTAGETKKAARWRRCL